MKVTAVHPLKASRGVILPLALAGVRAGFPSPADDYIEDELDLTKFLVKNKAATFLVRAAGDSMEGAGIRDGALLVVDRSAEAHDGSIVIAVVDGQLTVKRLRRVEGRAWLEAANPRYKAIEVSGDDMVWGVVAHAVQSFK